MKSKNIIFILFCLIIGQWSYAQTKAKTGGIAKTKTPTDTNYVDKAGKKQGPWYLTSKGKGGCYKAGQRTDMGTYKDDKKDGIWTELHCNGKVKNTTTYVNGVKEGEIKSYFEDGSIKEEGIWKSGHWVGRYVSYKEDGSSKEITYDEKGKEIVKKEVADSDNDGGLKKKFWD